VSWGLTRSVDSPVRLAVAGAVSLLSFAALAAGVSSSTSQRSFIVEGSTASGLVRFMNSHALAGDHGDAYASIHPNYNLSLKTRQSGGMCRPEQVGVHVSFNLTLPVAASPGAMSRSTRSAWNGFANFARVHEAHHKASYLGCASAFVISAKRQSAPSCFALEADIERMLRETRRACEIKQRSYDQSQARVLARLSLFSMARYQRRH
jgi:predicted secreted Zn-dependent protease